MIREKVYEAIDSERFHQDKKWGKINEHPHEVGAWITIMRKLLNDAEIAWCENGDDRNALIELRKVIAVGVACAEQHGIPLRSYTQSVSNKR